MDTKKLAEVADPKKLADYISNLPRPHHDHGAGGSVETLRKDKYEGHHIVIRTTYIIEVDGKIFPLPLTLGNDGQLHCHSLPNYQFTSAVDMVKHLIDTFPEDFPLKQGTGEHSAGGGHEPHGHKEGGS